MTQGPPPPWQTSPGFAPPGQPSAAPPWQQTAQPAPAQSPPWGAQPAPVASPPPAPQMPGQPPAQMPGQPPAQNPPWGAPAAAPQAAPAPMGYGPPPVYAPAQAASQGWGQPAPMAPPMGYGAPPGYPAPGMPPAGYGPPQGYPGAAQSYGPPGQSAYGGPLDGLGDAESFAKTPYFPPGVDCVVQLEEFKLVPSKNPASLGALFVVAECSIVSSNTQGIAIGARFSQAINLQKYGKGDLQMLLTALHGGTPGNPEHRAYLKQQGIFEPANVYKFGGPDQPLRGRKLGLRTSFKPHAQPALAAQGKGFTNHFWSPVQ